jgi:hypothetical protein
VNDRTTPAGPSGYLMAAGALLLLAPLSLVAWAAGSAAVRAGARRPIVALAGVVPGVAAAVLLGRGMTRAGAATLLGIVGSAGPLRPSTTLLGAVAGGFLRWAIATAPVGLPAGLIAASIPPPDRPVPAAEWDAKQRRARDRAEVRIRKRATKRADREGADPRSPALAVSLGGSVHDWRIGDLIVPPPRQLGHAMLLLGAPGVGKSTAAARLGYLCARERRHLVVVDAKGGPDALAEGMVAAYLSAWPDARVRLFPQERLDIWRGSPQAIVNRLVEVWDWTAESSYWREAAMTALRLALGQPGPPCRSGAELVARLDPAALARAHEHDPAALGLIRRMSTGTNNELAGVHIRVGNLVAALGGALDGNVSWEDADLWVVTVPAMVASRDADSCLRVLLSDYGHFTMARKDGRPSHLLVDEFAAIGGGRRSVIDLLERGRGARSGVTLSGQSAVALGPEEERGRLFAAVSAVLAFRTPQPAEIAALAGSERLAEGAWSFGSVENATPDRVTVTARARGRVDQDQARQLPTGEAQLIVAGMVERVRIIRTAIPPAAADQARELVAGQDRPPNMIGWKPAPADRPADAVDVREVPAPPAPRQGASPAPRRPPGGLDPPPAPRVRRHRPPQVGPGSPPDDRAERAP